MGSAPLVFLGLGLPLPLLRGPLGPAARRALLLQGFPDPLFPRAFEDQAILFRAWLRLLFRHNAILAVVGGAGGDRTLAPRFQDRTQHQLGPHHPYAFLISRR